MNLDRLNEILNGLGVSRRELARRVPWLAHDGKDVSRWRKDPSTVPPQMEAWLEELWSVRDDDEALEAAWARVPPAPGSSVWVEANEPPMTPAELEDALAALDLSGRGLQSLVSWMEPGEVGAWRAGAEPVEPGVARWLRALKRAIGDDAATAKLLRRPPPPPTPGAERFEHGPGRTRRRIQAPDAAGDEGGDGG